MKFKELKTGRIYILKEFFPKARRWAFFPKARGWAIASKPDLFDNTTVGSIELNQMFVVLDIDPYPKDNYLWVKVLNSQGIVGWIAYCWHDQHSPLVIEASNETK